MTASNNSLHKIIIYMSLSYTHPIFNQVHLATASSWKPTETGGFCISKLWDFIKSSIKHHKNKASNTSLSTFQHKSSESKKTQTFGQAPRIGFYPVQGRFSVGEGFWRTHQRSTHFWHTGSGASSSFFSPLLTKPVLQWKENLVGLKLYTFQDWHVYIYIYIYNIHTHYSNNCNLSDSSIHQASLI